jgi:hypothetical protein
MDLAFTRGRRVVDPVIQAAALHGVVDLARAVRRHDHDRRFWRLDGAQLGDGDLEVGQDFEQVRLERFVGAIEFVDQQHRRLPGFTLQGLQQSAADEEGLGIDVLRKGVARGGT